MSTHLEGHLTQLLSIHVTGRNYVTARPHGTCRILCVIYHHDVPSCLILGGYAAGELREPTLVWRPGEITCAERFGGERSATSRVRW